MYFGRIFIFFSEYKIVLKKEIKMENEKFIELYLRLCKGITPINEEKSEYDTGIDYEEEDSLNFEEEQKLDKWWKKAVEEISDLLIPMEGFFDEEDE
jgi:hypothetical protein